MGIQPIQTNPEPMVVEIEYMDHVGGYRDAAQRTSVPQRKISPRVLRVCWEGAWITNLLASCGFMYGGWILPAILQFIAAIAFFIATRLIVKSQLKKAPWSSLRRYQC